MRKYKSKLHGAAIFLIAAVLLFAGIIMYLSHQESDTKNYIGYNEALGLSFMCIFGGIIFQLIIRGLLCIIIDFDELKDVFINIPNFFINLKIRYKINKLHKLNAGLSAKITKTKNVKKALSESIERELEGYLSVQKKEDMVSQYLIKIDNIDFEINTLRLDIEKNEYKITNLTLSIRSTNIYDSHLNASMKELHKQRNIFLKAKRNLENLRMELNNSLNASSQV